MAMQHHEMRNGVPGRGTKWEEITHWDANNDQIGRCTGGTFGWRFGRNMRDIGSVFFFMTGDRGTGFAGELSDFVLDDKGVGVEAVIIRGCVRLLELDAWHVAVLRDTVTGGRSLCEGPSSWFGGAVVEEADVDNDAVGRRCITVLTVTRLELAWLLEVVGDGDGNVVRGFGGTTR
jgi:hypothetical protein